MRYANELHSVTDCYSVFFHFSSFLGCESGKTALSCSGDLCESVSCEAHDNSVCEVDSCSNCTVKHYVGVEEVTDQCGMYYIIKSS